MNPSTSIAPSTFPSLLPSSNPSASIAPSAFPSLLPSMICAISKMRIEITTDSHAEETTWEILDDENKILHEGGSYTIENNAYMHEHCIGEGSYKFIIYDSWGDGIYDDGGYMIKIDDKIVKEGKLQILNSFQS